MGGFVGKSKLEDNNLETFSLIWLDVEVNISQENILAQKELRTAINHLKTFENDQLCEKYIQSSSEIDRIVLIVSGRLGSQIVPRIHELRQVSSIYIYCTNRQKYEEWANQFIKVQGVFIVLKTLIERICSDQDRRKHDKVDEQLSISIFNTKHYEKPWKSESNDHFIYSQILIDCLLQMQITPIEKAELISLCKTEYKENKAELRVIGEFERDNLSNRAIWWFTRESSLYKMLNKALRIQNINLLFLFRYVIHDIEHQLEENNYLSSICAYRAQLISKNELQMLKDSREEFISINSFLTAILYKKSALLSLNQSKVSDDTERVLFEIQADGTLADVKAFSNIKSKSYYKHEEILFSIGSIFQLNDIRLGEDNIWIIQMTLCSTNHSQLKPIFQNIERQYGNTKTSLLSFGLYLQKMNKFDEATDYYNRLIKILPPKHEHIVICKNAIKNISVDKVNFEKALESINKSLEVYMETPNANNHLNPLNYNNEGESYRKGGDLQHTLEYYNKALTNSKKLYGDDHQEVSRCYKNIGLVYQEKDEYEQALVYYQKAITILERCLPEDHPDLRTMHCTIGDVHRHLGHYDQALADYFYSFKNSEEADGSQNPSIVSLLNKIAFIYEQKKDIKEALMYYDRIESLLPFTHVDAVKNQQNIQRILSQLK